MHTGWRRTALAVFLAVAALSGGQAAAAALTLGSRGNGVTAVQEALIALGLLSGRADGVFGPATREAVRSFQRREGLVADGVVGPATLSQLQAKVGRERRIVHRVSRGDTVYGIARRYGISPVRVAELNHLADPGRIQPGQELVIPVPAGIRPSDSGPVTGGGAGELMPWPDASRLFPNGTRARVIDVRTGMAFRVRRIQGTNHADCVPLTLEDTGALKVIYGGRWSWERRAIVVEIGGRRLAASMNGYPHGTGYPAQNGFPGHFCIHFYESRTHGSNVEDLDHQAAVLAAARWSPED